MSARVSAAARPDKRLNPLFLIREADFCYTDTMTAKNFRLAKVRDFNLLLKHGFFYRGDFLDLRVLELAKNTAYFPKNEDPDKFKNQLRLAYAVGLKVHKSAVQRNRLKRKLRESVRLMIKSGRIKSGYYLLFVAKPSALNKNFAEISQEAELLLGHSKALLN